MGVLYYPPTTNGLQKTLDAQLDQGVTASATLNNTTGVQNEPGVIVVNRIDSDGAELAASVREFITYTGTSGATLTGLTRGIGGSSDQDHAVGSVVEFVPDISVFQSIIDALTLVVDPDDTTSLQTTIVTLTGTQTLTNKTLTSPTLTSPVLNTGVSGTAVLDEDDMSSNSATALATQQSIKAYVDNNAPTSTFVTCRGLDLGDVSITSDLVYEVHGSALTITNPSVGALDVVANYTSFYSVANDTSNTQAYSKVEISTDGGSTWNTGSEIYVQAAATAAQDRIQMANAHFRNNVTPTGDIHVRVQVKGDKKAGATAFQEGTLTVVVTER